jgi:hypothetical protein
MTKELIVIVGNVMWYSFLAIVIFAFIKFIFDDSDPYEG